MIKLFRAWLVYRGRKTRVWLVKQAQRWQWQTRQVTNGIRSSLWLAYSAVATKVWAALFGRNFRLLMQGLPAIIVGVTVLIMLSFAALTPAQEIEDAYWEKARTSVAAGKFAEAQVCFERLAQLKTDNAQDVLFEWASAAGAAGRAGVEGQKERCRVLMNQLAPAEYAGYGKAHFWVAVDLLTSPNPTAQGRKLAEIHLLRTLEAGVEDREVVHLLLGELYIAKGLDEEAKAHLLNAIKTKPEARMFLMRIYARQGDVVNAKKEGRMAANIFASKAKADPLNHYARVRWADVTAFLEEYREALAILYEGLTLTGDPLYHKQLAQVYALEFDYLGRSDRAITGERLSRLATGLRHDPKNFALLDRLLGVIGSRRKHQPSPVLAATTLGLAGTVDPHVLLDLWVAHINAEADAARAILERLAVSDDARSGEARSQVHFALGIDAWDRGLMEAARTHWEQALGSPEVPSVANNLAHLLYQTTSKETDLNKALELARLAVDKVPTMEFRRTRGNILVKIGKNLMAKGKLEENSKSTEEGLAKLREAVADLEAALSSSPNKLELHRTLAEIYERLNLPRLAAEHQRLVSELASKKNANQP
jgi:tetratricopeptide (TPR) repeat protein